MKNPSNISSGESDALRAAIMNIPCHPYPDGEEFVIGYKFGHRDARHAAAELVAALDTQRAPAEPVASNDLWLVASNAFLETMDKNESIRDAWQRVADRVLAATQPAESKACASVGVEPTETEALRERIAELEAELLPFKEAEAASILRAKKRDRAESIANALFPRYDSVYARRHPEEKPPQWHEKSWWWNGVSVDFDESDIYDAYGTASLSLSSYVGGGETDTTVVKFPAQWLDADSLVEPIAAFIAEKVGERSARKAASDAAEAQRQIEQAKATLRRLTGEQS